ncbi:hypothetical protein SmJEL517_g02256 [Synchytrium microbalum]|uniref:Prolyl endopeptidase n=1 Tax=Synchytrium microbalum TaxID=1806994 RepID=A0A507CBB5_9FUNG|nr:uncharacterized protein SmJEL517_g02256 [Synchytrium microbalum]TPX35244.1 hypothetical protein SmJEL517_g02256 [Synchytrium microbalum]
MSNQHDEAVLLFTQFASIPSYSAASVITNSNGSGITISLTSTIRDIERKVKRKFQTVLSATLSADGKLENATSGYPVDVENVSLESTSTSGLLCCARSIVEKDSKKKRFIEIFNKTSMLHQIDVTDRHGEFYNDGEMRIYKSNALPFLTSENLETFGALSWSPDEHHIAYVAEKNRSTDGFQKFAYEPDFGEGYTKKAPPVIVVITLPSCEVQVRLSPCAVGQPLFLDNDKLLYLQVPTQPINYGIRFCTNRIMNLATISISSQEIETLSTPSGFNARYPRITPDRKHLIYISNRVGGPHNSTCRIMKSNLVDGKVGSAQLLVDMKPLTDEIPGLYLDKLSTACFAVVKDTTYLLCTTIARCQLVMVAIDVESGKVVKLDTEPSVPGQDVLENVVFSTVTLHKNLDYILVSPKQATSKGTIVYPHGGPHSAFTTDWSLYCVCLCLLGYSLALVNYTGSVGYGEESIQALIGKVGETDVEDVHQVTQALIKDGGGKMALLGGSHGGFLTAHLLGLYPDVYRCGVLRNPVINVGAMYANTDIPDWTFAESGVSFVFETPPVLSSADYTTMYNKSPVSVAANVKGPVLLLLGEGDRRVPPSEGLRWSQYLKGRNVDVTVLMFPDTGHALDSVESEVFGFYALANFYSQRFI